MTRVDHDLVAQRDEPNTCRPGHHAVAQQRGADLIDGGGGSALPASRVWSCVGPVLSFGIGLGQFG